MMVDVDQCSGAWWIPPCRARQMPASSTEPTMQFELSTVCPDAASLTAATRELDPQAKVVLDADRGRLEVLASASGAQILDALARIGCVARPLEKEVHISGGSTCCGHCG